jgi:hypothetical protein
VGETSRGSGMTSGGGARRCDEIADESRWKGMDRFAIRHFLLLVLRVSFDTFFIVSGSI